MPVRVLSLIVLLVVLLSGGVQAAQAHAALVSSDPAEGAVLDAPPTRIVLTFNEEISPRGAAGGPETAVFVDRRAQEWSSQVDGARLILTPDATPIAGEYVVNFRVVSADGHPITGGLNFSATGESTPATTTSTSAPTTAAPTTPPTAEPTAAATTDESGPAAAASGESPWSSPWVLGSLILAIAVVLAAVALRGGRQTDRPATDGDPDDPTPPGDARP